VARFETPDGISIAYDIQGDGPPVLMLHGFPQNRAMWHAIAPALARDFTVVTADLRGYGDSTKPARMEEMGFRPMAADQTELMRHLGFDRFHLVGHDRGARTAYRLTLDTPDAPLSLALLDIVPTDLLLEGLTQKVARAYYHWFFLAQPSPFPETLIGHDPDAYFQSCLAGWGGNMDDFDAAALAAYRTSWRDPGCIRAMCHDYRAAIDVDFALDVADRGRRVSVPSLVLFGTDGIMGRAYDVAATWASRLENLRAAGLPGGHFFPDTHPKETTATLLEFLRAQA
jgi:haloacetate dehalogenase